MTMIQDIIQYIVEPLRNTFSDNMKIEIIKHLYKTNDK